MKKNIPIVRTCLACGLEKPLAAFLQLSGTQGTVYGNICSSCRSSEAKSKAVVPKQETDETGRTGVGSRIDAKTKVKTEIIQKTIIKQAKEADQLEKKQKDLKITDQLDKKETQEKAEKHHRKEYIETKQKEGKKSSQAVVTRKTTFPLDKSFIATQQTNSEAAAQASAIDQENKLTTVDTSQVFLDSQFGELKFQTEIFKRFKDSVLGESAFSRTIERIYKRKKTAAEPAQPEDPLAEFAKKTWKK
jgi:hypothetical protein